MLQLQQSDLSSIQSTELQKRTAKYYQLEFLFSQEKRQRQNSEVELERLRGELSLKRERNKETPKP